MEVDGASCSIRSSNHCSTLMPRACACAFKAASRSGDSSSVSVMRLGFCSFQFTHEPLSLCGIQADWERNLKRAMLFGVPWSKRMSISGRETVYRNNWSCKAACDKFKDCVHLFPRHVELFHYFLNGHTSLKIHKHSGDGYL